MTRFRPAPFLLVPLLLLAGCGSDSSPDANADANDAEVAAADDEVAVADDQAADAEDAAAGDEAANNGEDAADDSESAAESTYDSRATGPHCQVTGTFTPDAEAHGDEVPTLEDIGATELPAYEVTGMADYENWQADSGFGGGGAKGPWTMYHLAFHDGELGYRVDLQVFPESPMDSQIEVRRFTDVITFMNERPGEVIAWQALPEDEDLDGLAADGTGGDLSFRTTRGGIGASEFFYPLHVELEFDCPEGAIREG